MHAREAGLGAVSALRRRTVYGGAATHVGSVEVMEVAGGVPSGRGGGLLGKKGPG